MTKEHFNQAEIILQFSDLIPYFVQKTDLLQIYNKGFAFPLETHYLFPFWHWKLGSFYKRNGNSLYVQVCIYGFNITCLTRTDSLPGTVTALYLEHIVSAHKTWFRFCPVKYGLIMSYSGGWGGGIHSIAYEITLRTKRGTLHQWMCSPLLKLGYTHMGKTMCFVVDFSLEAQFLFFLVSIRTQQKCVLLLLAVGGLVC